MSIQMLIGFNPFEHIDFDFRKSLIKAERHPKTKVERDIRKLKRLEELAHTTLAHYIPITYRNSVGQINIYFSHLEFYTRNHGILLTINFVKETRVAVMRFISGMKPTAHTLVKLDRSGWPVWLPRFDLPSEGGYTLFNPAQIESIKLLMTLLTCLRGILTKSNPDFTTISDPSNERQSIITDREISYACKALGVKSYVTESDWDGYHFSMKSGIFGKALDSSIRELPYVLSNLDLVANIKAIGGPRLTQLFEGFEALPIMTSIGTNGLGKLVDFPDKEGKTRIVAILDYWSQTALFNVHQVLFKNLKNIEADCTFDQGKFKTKVNSLLGPFYSYDLTAATDRMPIALQMRVMERVIGYNKTIAWAKLLTDRPYLTSMGKPITYAVGQPMGGYSSWPAMALTHHFIVQLAAHYARVKGNLNTEVGSYFPDYALLGDDIIICNTPVASEYLELLKILDMPISLPKSLESLDSYEFAKRLFVNRIEVTGFSLSGLESIKRSYSLLKNFLITQEEHGWSIPFGIELQYVFNLFRISRNHDNSIRLLKLYKIFHFIVGIKRPLTDVEFWNSFLRSVLKPGTSLILPEGLSPGQFLLSEIAKIRLTKMKRNTEVIHSGLITSLERGSTIFSEVFSSKLLVESLTSCLPSSLTVLMVVKTSIDEVVDFSKTFADGFTKSLGHSVSPGFFDHEKISGEAALVKPLLTNVNNIVTTSVLKRITKIGLFNHYYDYAADLEILRQDLKKSLIRWGKWAAIKYAFTSPYDYIWDIKAHPFPESHLLGIWRKGLIHKSYMNAILNLLEVKSRESFVLLKKNVELEKIKLALDDYSSKAPLDKQG
jgi:hypothetical protein